MSRYKKSDPTRQSTAYQFAGWVLFIICAGFFAAAAWKNGDTLTFIGSIVFLVACILFLVPLIRPGEKVQNDTMDREAQ